MVSQYLQFRSWLRSGSAAEKKLAATAAVISVGLVGWALVPTGGGSSSVATGANGFVPAPSAAAAAPSGGTTGGAGGTNGSSGAASGGTATGSGAVATGSVGGSGGGGAGTAGAAGGGSVASGSGTGSVASGSGSGGGGGATPTGGGTTSNGGGTTAAGASCAKGNTDTGVTSGQIKVADILLNLAGAIGNAAVSQASPQEQQAMAQAVVDDINAAGGVQCRKLVVDYYSANPIDPSSTQTICLQLQQAGVFAVIGGFAFPQGADDCLAQAHIPVVGNIAPTPDEARQYYPYLMSIAPDPVADYKTAVLGLQSKGWFSAAQGFKKIAILEDDCSPEINQAVYSFILQAGVPASDIVKNEFSCPSSGFASPSDMSGFATQDNLAHITNVAVVTGGGSFKEFSDAAAGQGYKPRYLVGNYQGFLVTATGPTGPDPNNFDGTIATTASRFGEDTTPGAPEGPATAACVADFTKHGLPASDVLGPYLGGGVCNLFKLFAAAASHDTSLTRAGLAPALPAVGNFPEAFPQADSVYRAPGATTPVKVTGGDFWWTIQFQASCTCWKVIDPTERPAF